MKINVGLQLILFCTTLAPVHIVKISVLDTTGTDLQ